MFRKLYEIFGSLNLGLCLMVGVALLLGVGSFATGPEESALLNSMPLFAWLSAVPVTSGWWLWLTIGLLGLLAVNTLLCSIESLRMKASRPGLLSRLAPQVMHAGFLLIVLAHLISSAMGFKQVMQVAERSVVGFPDDTRVRIERLDADVAPQGHVTGFSATVMTGDGRRAVISPNVPFFFQGFGLYLKHVEIYPVRMGILEIHREPGAGMALAGALLFTAGNIIVVVRRRHDRERGMP